MNLEERARGALDRPSSLSTTSDVTFRTYSGRVFDLVNPTPDMVRIVDVAMGLANQCRYNGQIGNFYSVAQHSCEVSIEVQTRLLAMGRPHLTVLRGAMMGLLHDAAEAYVGDVISPLKHLFPDFGVIEDRIFDTVLLALDQTWLPDLADLVDGVDKGAFAQESVELRGASLSWVANGLKTDLTPWIPTKPIGTPALPFEAFTMFLTRYNNLAGRLYRIREEDDASNV